MAFREHHPLPHLGQGMNNPFMSLTDKNFRTYWVFSSFSSLASWVQNAAQPWLAYRMTDSPFMLGMVTAIQFMPMFLFSLLAGVVIDRASKKRVLMITQWGYILIALIMALLLYSGKITYSYVLIIACCTGLLNVFNIPVKQAMIGMLLTKKHLVNGVALYSIAFNLCRIIGPAIVGLVVSKWNIGLCYWLNAALLGFSTLGLATVKTLEPLKKMAHVTLANVLSDMLQGLAYARRHKQIYEILIMMAITGIFSINFSVLLPVLSVEILQADARGFGNLMSVMGIGSLVGAFCVALRSRGEPQRFFLYAAPVILALIWLLISQINGSLIYIALAFSGFFYIAFSATASAALQLHTSKDYLGRIISLNSLVLAGTSPLGNFYSGSMTELLGIGWGTFSCGLAAILCFLAFFLYHRRLKA